LNIDDQPVTLLTSNFQKLATQGDGEALRTMFSLVHLRGVDQSGEQNSFAAVLKGAWFLESSIMHCAFFKNHRICSR
jgi:hypothetical protein